MKFINLIFRSFIILFVAISTTACDIDSEPKKVEETTFFSNKYTKEKVWDAFRSPAYPTAGQDWLLYNLKAAIDDNGTIDFGTNRYVQFVATVDTENNSTSVTDDMFNIGTKYAISLNLYESNGTLVRVISTYGQIIGIGDKGFMYVAEGYYGMFFPLSGAVVGQEITYKPTTGTVTKLSELYK